MEDQEILGLLEKRSEQALGEVERRYGALCLSLARRLLGRNEDAEECVNDAYLRLWNAVPPAKPCSISCCRIHSAFSRHGAASWPEAASPPDGGMRTIQECEAFLRSRNRSQ